MWISPSLFFFSFLRAAAETSLLLADSGVYTKGLKGSLVEVAAWLGGSEMLGHWPDVWSVGMLTSLRVS